MSDAFDPSVVVIKEEVEEIEENDTAEPWGYLQEGEVDPLGHVECHMPQQEADLSVVNIEVEIDIAGYDLQQPPITYNEESPTTSQLTPTVAESLIYKDSFGVFKCYLCEYTCNFECLLKRHIMKHTGEKPFKCDQCEYRCSRREYLKTHLTIHTGEKPFKCDQCDYKSGHKSDYNKHLLKHTGVKPFQCDQCEYKSTRKNDVKNHRRTHTGEKPFKCDQCDYRFTRIDNLKSHLKTHDKTAEKKFKCDQCEYRCNRSAHLRCHLRTHLPEFSRKGRTVVTYKGSAITNTHASAAQAVPLVTQENIIKLEADPNSNQA